MKGGQNGSERFGHVWRLSNSTYIIAEVHGTYILIHIMRLIGE
jgi:hypothetical protein